jgi:hypothetical protein
LEITSVLSLQPAVLDADQPLRGRGSEKRVHLEKNSQGSLGQSGMQMEEGRN